MNMYNPLAATQRREATGLTRKQAEAIAEEIDGGTSDLVTKEMLEAALDKQTIKLSLITAGMLTLFCTVIGTLVAVLASMK